MGAATDDELLLREAQLGDVAQMLGIYNHYVEETIVTFEEEPVSVQEFGARLSAIQAHGLPWLVAERAGSLLGYAYASLWKSRASYRRTMEVTVYLASQASGMGIGSALYARLLGELKSGGAHTALGGIALPNPGSVALHEKFGFSKVAHLKEVGFKFGSYVDVAYYQLVF